MVRVGESIPIDDFTFYYGSFQVHLHQGARIEKSVWEISQDSQSLASFFITYISENSGPCYTKCIICSLFPHQNSTVHFWLSSFCRSTPEEAHNQTIQTIINTTTNALEALRALLSHR